MSDNEYEAVQSSGFVAYMPSSTHTLSFFKNCNNNTNNNNSNSNTFDDDDDDDNDDAKHDRAKLLTDEQNGLQIDNQEGMMRSIDVLSPFAPNKSILEEGNAFDELHVDRDIMRDIDDGNIMMNINTPNTIPSDNHYIVPTREETLMNNFEIRALRETVASFAAEYSQLESIVHNLKSQVDELGMRSPKLQPNPCHFHQHRFADRTDFKPGYTSPKPTIVRSPTSSRKLSQSIALQIDSIDFTLLNTMHIVLREMKSHFIEVNSLDEEIRLFIGICKLVDTNMPSCIVLRTFVMPRLHALKIHNTIVFRAINTSMRRHILSCTTHQVHTAMQHVVDEYCNHFERVPLHCSMIPQSMNLLIDSVRASRCQRQITEVRGKKRAIKTKRSK